jgi:hypothetical protein
MVSLIRVMFSEIERLGQIQEGQLHVALERVTNQPGGIMLQGYEAMAKTTLQCLQPVAFGVVDEHDHGGATAKPL